MAKGPIGNAPRDLRDEFVGENVLYKGGEPPKKSRGPKRVTSNTFHSKVTGPTSNKRADRPGHFRSGGFVRGKTGADAGDMKAGFPKGPSNKKLLADADDMEPVVKGSVKKRYADGGSVGVPELGERTGPSRPMTPDERASIDQALGAAGGIGRRDAPMPPPPRIRGPDGGLYKKGGSVKKADGGSVPMPKPDPRYHIEDADDLEPGIAKKWNEQMGRVRSIVRGDKQPWDKRPEPGPLPGRKKGGEVK